MSCELPDKFTILDGNFKKLQLPDGIRASGIEVSSIERERNTESVEGIPGNINYGSDFNSRNIMLSFTLRTKYEFDFTLMRNELYSLFSTYDSLYLVENTLPSRIIEVSIDESVLPDKVALHFYSTLEVNAETVGLPFWRTKYTTQELNTSGYSSAIEKYGTADGINVDNVEYTFTQTRFKVWNGGDVTVDPRNMLLNIRLYRLKTTGTFKLKNLTTGEEFHYKNTLTGNTIDINGTKVLMGLSQNRLRDTNRQFISLVPGENEIQISGGSVENIQFDYPFYYK